MQGIGGKGNKSEGGFSLYIHRAAQIQAKSKSESDLNALQSIVTELGQRSGVIFIQ